jgi:hypothetical protein
LAFAKKNPDAPVQERMQGSGRPSKVKAADLKAMENILKTTPTATAKKRKERVPGLENVSVRTIQDLCLKKLKLPSRKMASKPLLTQKMKAKRLAFARWYQHWGWSCGKKVMFSDESHFVLRIGGVEGRCRRPVGSDRFSEWFTKKTVKHPPKIMAWGCFSWKGQGGLEFLGKGGMMNGTRSPGTGGC